MRQFTQRPALHNAVANGGLSQSWAQAIAGWTCKLPTGLRDEADKTQLQAARSSIGAAPVKF